MDHGERIAKVEAEVSAVQEQLNQIHAEQVRLHEGIDKLRDHTDRGLNSLRDHTDRRLDALREHMDQEFSAVRTEIARTTRWAIGLAIAYGASLIGIMAKLAGIY